MKKRMSLKKRCNCHYGYVNLGFLKYLRMNDINGLSDSGFFESGIWISELSIWFSFLLIIMVKLT